MGNNSRRPVRSPHTLSPIAEAHLIALRARCARGLVSASPHDRGQILALAEQYIDKARLRHGAGAPVITLMFRAIEPLMARCAQDTIERSARAAPPKHLTTVGELRALLAGLSDETLLSQVPCVNPEWSAQAAEALRLLPPVRHVASTHPALRSGTPFGLYGTPTSEELFGA